MTYEPNRTDDRDGYLRPFSLTVARVARLDDGVSECGGWGGGICRLPVVVNAVRSFLSNPTRKA